MSSYLNCYTQNLLLVAFGFFLSVPPTYAQTNQSCTIKIIRATGTGFEYGIYKNNKLFIPQPSIPAMAGNNGFTTVKSTEMVGEKVVKKIQKGQTFPTITIEELKQRKVLSK